MAPPVMHDITLIHPLEWKITNSGKPRTTAWLIEISKRGAPAELPGQMRPRSRLAPHDQGRRERGQHKRGDSL
jgi:hypothetical protein